MKILKKLFTLILVLAMTSMTTITSFSVGVNDTSQYITTEEAQKRLAKVKNSINLIKNSFSNDLNTKIKEFFDPVLNEPVVGSVGIGVDKDTTNNKWRIYATGAEYTTMEGEYTREQLFRLLENSPRTKLCLCTKLKAEASPFRNPSSTATTASVYTGLIEIYKANEGYDRIEVYNPESGRKYVSRKAVGGTDWFGWETLDFKVPWGTCSTDAATNQKEVKFKYDQYNSGETIFGQAYIIKFTNMHSGGNVTLKINNGTPKNLMYKGSQMAGDGVWFAGTIMLITKHGTNDFKVTLKNKTGLQLLATHDATTSSTTWTYRKYFKAYYVEHNYHYSTTEYRKDTMIISSHLVGTTSIEHWTGAVYGGRGSITASEESYAQMCFSISQTGAASYFRTGTSWVNDNSKYYAVV